MAEQQTETGKDGRQRVDVQRVVGPRGAVRLSAAQRRALEYLATDEGDGDMVNAQGQWWYGTHRTSAALAYSLLRLGLISSCWGGDDARYYTITTEGRHVLRDPAYVPAALRHLRGEAGPFLIPPLSD